MLKRLMVAVVLTAVTMVPAFARNQNKNLTIPRNCVVQGQEIKSGAYTAQFVDDKEGELVLLDGRKELARMPYKIVTLPKAANGDVVVFNNNNGTRSISRIEFKGLTTALQFD
ncbi:MAG: hypothetical protein K1Y36_09215 [Blastocatellia bacterium]|nr:hypothetical protein [Blastocatellia bacterium]